MSNEIKTAYKGFNRDLTCRGFQYEVGKTYKHDSDVVKCAEGGFHSCLNPLDIFSYYNPADSVFYEVEIGGNIDTDDDDTKIASAEITIKAEINLPDVCSKAIEWIVGKTKKSESVYSEDDRSHASNTGNYPAASNTGNRSAASNTGYRSAASNTGYRSAASNTGDYSAASNTGYRSAASVNGKNSIALASGYKSKAKACSGSAITCVYRDGDYRLIHVRSAIAGKDIEPNVYYTLDANGEFIKA